MMSVVELSRMQPHSGPAPLPLPPSSHDLGPPPLPPPPSQHELGYHSLPQSLGGSACSSTTSSRAGSAKNSPIMGKKQMKQTNSHRYSNSSTAIGSSHNTDGRPSSPGYVSRGNPVPGGRVSRSSSAGASRAGGANTRSSSTGAKVKLVPNVCVTGTPVTSPTKYADGKTANRFSEPPPYPGSLSPSGYHLSMSDSEASNISMCSSESLNSCQRQAPAGEETHVSGQPGYLHTGCHQYRNNMLAHLLHSPTNSGVTKKTHDGYYESSNRQPSPIPADSAQASMASLPVCATIPGSTTSCMRTASPATVTSPQHHAYNSSNPSIAHIGRSSIAHYVNIPSYTESAPPTTPSTAHSSLSSQQSSPHGSVHLSPYGSGNSSPNSSSGSPHHVFVQNSYPSQQLIGSPSLFYNSDMILPTTTSKHLPSGAHIVCTANSTAMQQGPQYIPSYMGPRPTIAEGAPPVQLGPFVEYPQTHVNLSPENTATEMNKEEYLNHMQHYLNLLNAQGSAVVPENLQEMNNNNNNNNNNMYRVHHPNMESPPQTQQPDINHATIAVKATQMVEKLSEDNRNLRQELEKYLKKMSKIQKFEMDIEKVNKGYESLMKHSEKREKLEEKMRIRMDIELRKLKETNAQLKDKLDRALEKLDNKGSNALCYEEASLKNLLEKKDTIISNMIEQNKELSATRDCFEVEVVAQRTTLQEQNVHIDMLDSQLLKTQANVARLEREVQMKQQQDYRLEQLQNTVLQLQRASEKKESIESKLREKLHDEVKLLKMQQSSESIAFDDEGISTDTESLSSMSSSQPTSIQMLQLQLQEKDRRILSLESDLAKTEQQYLEENVMKQLAENTAELPKEIQMAALEQNSKETEKLISECREDRLKHLEEVYRANRRCAELESSVKTLKSQLSEKDAIITLLQSPTQSLSSQSSLNSSPMHSPHMSGVISPPLSSAGSMARVMSPSLSGASSIISSACSSRQNSQIDSPIHSKSNSTASTSSDSSLISPKEIQLKELQQKITAQRALFRSLKSSSEHRTKYLSHFL